MLYQRSCLSIVFWLLQSNFSFCVSTYWVSVLGWRSVILHDKRFPQCVMSEGSDGQNTLQYFNLGEPSYQGSRGDT